MKTNRSDLKQSCGSRASARYGRCQAAPLVFAPLASTAGTAFAQTAPQLTREKHSVSYR